MTNRTGAARGEQVFFDDPAVDRMMGVVMALATEHYVLRDRVRALENELARQGSLQVGALDRVADAAEREATRADSEAFAHALLESLLGRQQSLGASGRFSLKRSQG